MKTLETECLILRKFTQDDFSAVHSYASVAENTAYLAWGPNTTEQTQAFIDMALSKAEETPCINHQFAAVLKDTMQLVGACNIALLDNYAEISLILHQDYWKKGYGTQMGKELLRFGFDDLEQHRIVAKCHTENQNACKIMEKIGMRHEGTFLEGFPVYNSSEERYSDAFSYAITKGEWETQKEIAYYTALPVVFDDFIEMPELSDGTIRLICFQKKQAIPEKKYAPAYDFYICKGSEKIGDINLRIGYAGCGPDESSLYYGGQIGYNVDEKYRGNGYAGCACRLLLPIAKAHGMTKLLITNNYSNTASRRVCEKLGARFLRMVRLPEWSDLYKRGERFLNIFEWDVE